MDYTNHSSDMPLTEDNFLSSFDAAGITANQGETNEDFLPAEKLVLPEQEVDFALPERLFDETEPMTEKKEGEDFFSSNPKGESVIAKYMGNEISLPKKEMEVLARSLKMPVQECIKILQKGMNYDRLQKRLDQQKEADAKGFSFNGQNTGSVLRNGLKKENGQGVMPKNREYRARELRASWQEALRAYPQTDFDKLKPEIKEKLYKGENPLQVLQQEEITELRQKLVKQEQKFKSSQRAFGSVKSDAAENKDQFLSGFLSVK